MTRRDALCLLGLTAAAPVAAVADTAVRALTPPDPLPVFQNHTVLWAEDLNRIVDEIRRLRGR